MLYVLRSFPKCLGPGAKRCVFELICVEVPGAEKLGFICVSRMFYCFQLKSCFADVEHVMCYLTAKAKGKMRSGSILPRTALGKKLLSIVNLLGFMRFV